jgi:Asp/Glu/hydantoin racemase
MSINATHHHYHTTDPS